MEENNKKNTRGQHGGEPRKEHGEQHGGATSRDPKICPIRNSDENNNRLEEEEPASWIHMGANQVPFLPFGNRASIAIDRRSKLTKHTDCSLLLLSVALPLSSSEHTDW